MVKGVFLNGATSDELAVVYSGLLPGYFLYDSVLYFDPNGNAQCASQMLPASLQGQTPSHVTILASNLATGGGQDQVIIAVNTTAIYVGYPLLNYGQQVTSLPPAYAVATGDISGDGFGDLAEFDAQGMLHYAVFDQFGNATVYSPGIGAGGQTVTSMFLRDMNGDFRRTSSGSPRGAADTCTS